MALGKYLFTIMRLLLIYTIKLETEDCGVFLSKVLEICHRIDEKIEGQRSEVIYPMLYSAVGAKQALYPEFSILNLFIAFSATLH